MAEGKRYSRKEAGGRGGWREGGMDWRVAGESGRWRGAGGCGWREDEGWWDFREWGERVKDGGM